MLKPSFQEMTLFVVFLEPLRDLYFLLARMIGTGWTGHSLSTTRYLPEAQGTQSLYLTLIITHIAWRRMISTHSTRSRTSWSLLRIDNRMLQLLDTSNTHQCILCFTCFSFTRKCLWSLVIVTSIKLISFLRCQCCTKDSFV